MKSEIKDLLSYERPLWQKVMSRIAGVDEAGRGPLAGPVVAAAVVFEPTFAESEIKESLAGLTDSKQVSESNRETFYDLLRATSQVEIGVGIATATEIDTINILQATHLAMRRAVCDLQKLPDHILVDGRPVPKLPAPSTAIVKGDALSLSIAAASIIAKVTRDRIMVEMDSKYPQYGFASHKGYGTKQHLQALKEFGATPAHRRSFRPVRECSAETFTQMKLWE